MTERLYYNDSRLTEFDAVVTEIQELSRENGQSLWRLALNRSAFYPTSGGQPHDTGQLIATSRGGAELTAEIVGVEEDDEGHVWHHTTKPLQPGTVVRGSVDAERRFDHMQQHSGQHLLSAAFIHVCGAETVSFHLGERTSTIDLAVDHLPEATIYRAEELANRIIAEDRTITVHRATREQAETWLASGELRKLPPREGDLRIIEIADFDRNACGGTHVRATGQIGGLHVRGTEKVRQGVRVEFVCGTRAMRTAREDFQTLLEVGRLLAVGSREIPQSIERLQKDAKQTVKEMQSMIEEVVEFRTAEIAREIASQVGVRIVRRNLAPPQYPSPAAAKLLASKLIAFSQQTVAIFIWRVASNESAITIIFARSADLGFDCGAVLREILAARGGRGGGSKDMAQGSISADRVEETMDALTDASKHQRAM